ncbi:MAG: hypothetical protein GXO48_06545 [Chlorobi bacterium]|nr:hypothetical protein [Chlorobiota bacterium]
MVTTRSNIKARYSRRGQGGDKVTMAIIMLVFLGILYAIVHKSGWMRTSEHNLNLIQNGSFETWHKGAPISWVIEGITPFDKPEEARHGAHILGIFNKDTVKKGAYQIVQLDPNVTYNLFFFIKGTSYSYGDIGYEIRYCGENVKATEELKPGKHFYTGIGQWQQIYGQFSGASCLELRFFSCCGSRLLVDDVFLAPSNIKRTSQ